jgi:hypothetical protein
MAEVEKKRCGLYDHVMIIDGFSPCKIYSVHAQLYYPCHAYLIIGRQLVVNFILPCTLTSTGCTTNNPIWRTAKSKRLFPRQTRKSQFEMKAFTAHISGYELAVN